LTVNTSMQEMWLCRDISAACVFKSPFSVPCFST
jgi:hypothetical protein